MSVERLEERLELIGDMIQLPPHGLGTGQIVLDVRGLGTGAMSPWCQSVVQTGGAANLGRESDPAEAKLPLAEPVWVVLFADPPYKPQAFHSSRVRQPGASEGIPLFQPSLAL